MDVKLLQLLIPIKLYLQTDLLQELLGLICSLNLLPKQEQAMQFWTLMLKTYEELKVHTCIGSTIIKVISLPVISKIRMNLETSMVLNFFDKFIFYCSYF